MPDALGTYSRELPREPTQILQACYLTLHHRELDRTMRALYPLPTLSMPPASRQLGMAADFDEPFIAADEAEIIALPPPPAAHPVRAMSPRELAALAHELYLDGSLDLDDYLLLGFPSELHPAFDRTIGALTGRKAQPDRQRDLIREWENRLADLHESSAPVPALIDRARRTLGLLRWLETPALGKPS